MRNLKRVCSYNDKYRDAEHCFLESLLANNGLEYVHVENDYSGTNVLRSFVLSENLGSLRCFCLK